MWGVYTPQLAVMYSNSPAVKAGNAFVNTRFSGQLYAFAFGNLVVPVLGLVLHYTCIISFLPSAAAGRSAHKGGHGMRHLLLLRHLVQPGRAGQAGAEKLIRAP